MRKSQMTKPLDMDRLMERWSGWVASHDGPPTKAYCSSLVAARIVQRISEEIGGVFVPRANASLCEVAGCEWFEDPSLIGEDVRFE